MRTLTALALFGGVNSVTANLSSWTSRKSPREQAPSSILGQLVARSALAAEAALPPQTNYTRGPKNPADDPRFKPFGCGVSEGEQASQDLIEVHKALFSDHAGGAPGARLRARALRQGDDNVEIPVVIHVVTTKAKENSIAKDVPEKQVEALNKAYKETGFAFKLSDTTWSADDKWSAGASDDDIMAMKKALRKGKYSTLNLYFQTDPAGSVLGVCTMPSDISDPSKKGSDIDPEVYLDDGCVINAGTMPGGSIFGYSQGMTAAHETGHWLGLFHVFEVYDCDGEGDLIADTAPQSVATDGCPSSAPSSCSGATDNVHNVMDYSTDACYTGFSPLQIQRMKDLWALYRKGN